ncbi:MAG: PstS family phosphate ABC transporter substrate-binding protein [Planctomycetaceae bacterium]|nr:PstS family phosphate ABC transporter substrate-binding protein [Planctomycetaceae bacterium]
MAFGLTLSFVGCGGSTSTPTKPETKPAASSDTKSADSAKASTTTPAAVPDKAAPQVSGGTIKIDGSSTVFPVSEAVAEEFQAATKIKVTVGISGTGGGFKKFVRGETDISNASRPILKEELEQAKTNGIEFIELPICFDALTIVVHPSNPMNEISTADLKKMWEPAAQEKVTKWKQINDAWPDEKLTLFGAGSDSGTFDYFTEAINGKSKASRGDFTASEDDNTLVQGVSGDKHSLGYIPFAYYEPNKAKLKALAVIDSSKKDAKPVGPAPENVLNGSYTPLSRPLFIYVNKKSADKPEVKQCVEFLLKNVADLATEVKYLPLPAQAYQMATERFAKRETGSVFGGVPEVGLTVEEILKRELKK